MFRNPNIIIDSYNHSIPSISTISNLFGFSGELAQNPLKSKDKLIQFYKKYNLEFTVETAKKEIEYHAAHEELLDESALYHIKCNKERYVCTLLLDEAMHDRISIFNTPCYKPFIEKLSLLMPVAAAFSSKKYITEVYRLNKFGVRETSTGLDVAIRLRDFTLLKVITEEASKNGISVAMLSKELYKHIKNGGSSFDFANPLHTAIMTGYVEGVMYLLAEGYGIEGFSSKLDSYLESAIGMASRKKSPKIDEDREEIIYHLMDYHADPKHKDYSGKNAIDLAKEAKLTRVIPVLENPKITKDTIHSFFQNSKEIESDRNKIDLICEYISPKHS